MLLVSIWAVLAAVAGLILILANPRESKLGRIGEILFLAGTLVTLFKFGGGTIRLGGSS